MMGFGFTWMLLLVVGTVLLVLWLVRMLFPQSGAPGIFPPEDEESSLEIARRRYAAGEISKEEFEAIRRGLT
jgi:putative membrane protein